MCNKDECYMFVLESDNTKKGERSDYVYFDPFLKM